MTKLLIDECLSAELARMARQRGHHEASHVVWIGKAGWKDWELKEVLLREDWTFVTWNCVDFRGPKETPGVKGQYAEVALHAGLICIDVPMGMDLAMQCRLFAEVLDELDTAPDLTNQVLQISLSEDGTAAELLRYSLPA